MVHGLEADMGGAGRVLRINANEPQTPLARELGLHLTPTFVLLDSKGEERYREIGRPPNRDRVLGLIRGQDLS